MLHADAHIVLPSLEVFKLLPVSRSSFRLPPLKIDLLYQELEPESLLLTQRPALLGLHNEGAEHLLGQLLLPTRVELVRHPLLHLLQNTLLILGNLAVI